MYHNTYELELLARERHADMIRTAQARRRADRARQNAGAAGRIRRKSAGRVLRRLGGATLRRLGFALVRTGRRLEHAM